MDPKPLLVIFHPPTKTSPAPLLDSDGISKPLDFYMKICEIVFKQILQARDLLIFPIVGGHFSTPTPSQKGHGFMLIRTGATASPRDPRARERAQAMMTMVPGWEIFWCQNQTHSF